LDKAYNKVINNEYPEKGYAIQSIVANPNVQSKHLMGVLQRQLNSDDRRDDYVVPTELYTNVNNSKQEQPHPNLDPQAFLSYMHDIANGQKGDGYRIRQFIHNLRNSGDLGRKALEILSKGSNRYVAGMAKSGLQG